MFAIADRVTVLRDGETVGTCARASVDRARLIRMMVGRELSAVFPKRRVPLGDVALELRSVSQPRDRRRATCRFAVRRGEILGLAGLVGLGTHPARRDPLRADAGRRRRDLRARQSRAGSTRRATRSTPGIAYVPEDRRQHGVVLEMSVAANTSLATLAAVRGAA